MKYFVLILSIIFLTGCVSHSMAPVIKDLEDDKALVQFILEYGDENPSQSELDLVAAKGCGIHGKKAKAISYHCTPKFQDYNYPKICEALYACFEE